MTRTMRLVALVAAVLLLASCQAVGKTSSASPPAKTVGKEPVVSGQTQTPAARCQVGATNEVPQTLALKMTSPTTGWALGTCTLASLPNFPNGSNIQCYAPQADWMGILHSTDGGATWVDVSPPSVANRTWHRAQFFLDANRAWVGEVSRTAEACASQVTVFMTADGGRTWEQGGSIPLKNASPTDDVFNVAGPDDNMDFVDPQHGWLVVVAPPSNPAPSGYVVPTTLYATSDGGMHWRLVASNPGKAALATMGCSQQFYAPASDVDFVTSSVGWLEFGCSPGMAILRTQDGGASWTVKPLPECGCQVFQPEFFDADHALITGGQGSSVMLTTSDGGATWAQRRVPSAAAKAFSFADPSNGWMVGIAQLPTTYQTVVYRTADGGQTWSLVSKPAFGTLSSSPRAYFPIVLVKFFGEQAGFVVLGAEAGTNGQADPGVADLQLLSTSDGGRTWNVVLKDIPAATCAGSYRQIGFGNGALMPVKMASPTVGWARGGLRTTDGGVHWRDVSPPALREDSVTLLFPPGYAELYLDGDHAWQAGVYGSSASCFDHVITLGTSDGGKTWRKSSAIPLNVAAGSQVLSDQIGFTSAQDGWLWVPRGATGNEPLSTQATEADLYATSDSGLSWRHVSHVGTSQLQGIPAPSGSQNCQPSLGRIEFSSPSVAWLSLNCSESQLLVSRDGGVTWRPQTFPASGAECPCYYDLPSFGDESHGMEVVSGNGGLTAGSPILYTSDGGRTWSVVRGPGTGYVLIVDWVNAQDLFALVTPPGWTKLSKSGFELYRSVDGGGTWTRVNANVPATWPPGFMQFVDLNHGFEANVNGATELLTTSDGGATWESIIPAVG